MRNFEEQIYKSQELYHLCWAEHGDGETRRRYVTMQEAEKAFEDARPIGGTDHVAGETRVGKLQTKGGTEYNVVIKAHDSGTFFFGGEDSRYENAVREAKRTIHLGAADRARVPRNRGNALRPGVHGLALVGREPWQDVYTVQTVIVAGDNEALMELREFTKAVDGLAEQEADLGFHLLKQVAEQYGTAVAAFHSSGVFHNDLHGGNILVLLNYGNRDISDKTNGPSAKLRFIDWGEALYDRYTLVRELDKNHGREKIKTCRYKAPDNFDVDFIERKTKHGDGKEEAKIRAGVVVRKDPTA